MCNVQGEADAVGWTALPMKLTEVPLTPSLSPSPNGGSLERGWGEGGRRPGLRRADPGCAGRRRAAAALWRAAEAEGFAEARAASAAQAGEAASRRVKCTKSQTVTSNSITMKSYLGVAADVQKGRAKPGWPSPGE